MDRVAIVGAGNVGATTALLLAEKQLAEVVLIDIAEGLARGKALDISQAMACRGITAKVVGGENFEELAGARLIIVTAGFPRGPGMSRTDLLQKNTEVIRAVVAEIKKHAPLSIIIVVTNPLDEMTFLAYRLSELARTTVFGMGGVLDSARFAHFISEAVGKPGEEIEAVVVGSHGDGMLPLARLATVAGTPLAKLLSVREIEEIVEKTRHGGAEIVGYLKSGSAFYGPAASVVKMAEAILHDTKAVLSVSCCLKGEYGLQDVCLSVPVRLGGNGIEEFIEFDLNEEELASLSRSAEQFRENLALVENA